MSATDGDPTPKRLKLSGAIQELDRRIETIRKLRTIQYETDRKGHDLLLDGMLIGYEQGLQLMKQCRYRPPQTQDSS